MRKTVSRSKDTDKGKRKTSEYNRCFRNYLGNHISKNNALHELEYQLQMGIDELKDKIEKLEWFVLQVSQYFSDSLQVLSLAIQGATQLSKIIVDNNGNYYVDGIDMTWF